MVGKMESLDVAAVQIPLHFRCPISLDLMSDPVTVSSGQTYDRTSIESWLAAGNTTCPVTRAALLNTVLIPNHTLRRLIQGWCKSSGVARIPTPKQPAEMSLLRSLLRSAAENPASIRRLRALARDYDTNRAALLSLGARVMFVEILFCEVGVSNLTETARESLALLMILSPLSESESESIATDKTRVGFLVSLLFHESIDVKVNSAALIESVAVGVKSPEMRSSISDSEGVFEGIVEVLRYPYPRAMRSATKALFALCLSKQSRRRAIAAGAAEALVDCCLPSAFEICDAERALATVELLCRVPEGCAAFAEQSLTVPVLVKMMLKVSDRATEYAAGALLSICIAEEGSRKEAVTAGAMTQLLLLVQSECTERAKRKAQMLLKLLRDSCPEGSIIANSDNFACTAVLPF